MGCIYTYPAVNIQNEYITPINQSGKRQTLYKIGYLRALYTQENMTYLTNQKKNIN
jgi:hypothetical protein